MKLKRRIKKRGEEVQVTLNLSFGRKELAEAVAVSSDKYIGLESIMNEDDDVAIAYFRILHHWLSVRPLLSKETILNHVMYRQRLEELWAYEDFTGKKKRVRGKRKQAGTTKGVMLARSSVEKKGRRRKNT